MEVTRRGFLQAFGGAVLALPLLKIALPERSSPATTDQINYVLNEEWKIFFTGWKPDANDMILRAQWVAIPIKRGQRDENRLPHFIEINEYATNGKDYLSFAQEFGYHDLMIMLQKYEIDHIPRNSRGTIDQDLLVQEVAAGRLKASVLVGQCYRDQAVAQLEQNVKAEGIRVVSRKMPDQVKAVRTGGRYTRGQTFDLGLGGKYGYGE